MSPTQVRIKKVSRIFRGLFQVLFLAVPVVHILAWIYAPASIDISGNLGFLVSVVPQGVKVLHPLTMTTRIIGFLVSLPPIIFIECILYFLIKLFNLYTQGEIFSAQNVRYIKKTGYSLLWTQITSILCNGALSAILSWGNPHGSGTRSLILTILPINITVILTAFLIILISWIMAEGCRLREEQQLTI